MRRGYEEGDRCFFPRALLYVCDQPEERAIMSLKGSGCLFPCTPCMVERDNSCTTAGAAAPSRDVETTVKSQLSNATMGTFMGAASRRAEVEMEHSLNSVVPAVVAGSDLETDRRCSIVSPGLTACTYVRLLSNSWSISRACPLSAHSYLVHRHTWLHSAVFTLFGHRTYC